MYDDDTEEIESDNYDDPNYDEEIERQDQSRFQESDSRILDFDDLQNELEEIKKDANSVTFNNVVRIRNITQNSQTGSDIVEENLAFDDYDRSKGTPIENLNINLGSDDIPRFSCGCHKLNLCNLLYPTFQVNRFRLSKRVETRLNVINVYYKI